jgi:electron transfer flavoprotein alpha subunit
MTVAVIAETEDRALTTSTAECVEEAREIADALGASVRVLLPGHNVAGLADHLAAHGADAVTIVQHQALRHFSADGWLAALGPILKEAGPTLVLAPDTSHAHAWLPQLAARWRIPLVSGCLQVRAGADGQIEMIRPTHAGARHECLTCSGTATLLATLLPSVRGVGAPRSNRQAEATHFTPNLSAASLRDRTLRRLPPDPRTVDVSEAERIVAGGLGIGGSESVDLLWQLADRLGAAVGGTRVISDRGWLPHERYIGTTGKTVAPKLYLALGISGASQHTAGMVDSETVIAINTDRSAPIFGLADLGIVGDLHQIVPALLAKLEENKTQSFGEATPQTNKGSMASHGRKRTRTKAGK